MKSYLNNKHPFLFTVYILGVLTLTFINIFGISSERENLALIFGALINTAFIIVFASRVHRQLPKNLVASFIGYGISKEAIIKDTESYFRKYVLTNIIALVWIALSMIVKKADIFILIMSLLLAYCFVLFSSKLAPAIALSGHKDSLITTFLDNGLIVSQALFVFTENQITETLLIFVIIILYGVRVLYFMGGIKGIRNPKLLLRNIS